MPTIEELQQRSRTIFESLLADEFPTRRPSRAAAASTRTGRTQTFSFFDPDDARESVFLATQFAVAAGAADTVEDGLAAALDLAENRRYEDSPALVRNALSIFVTHFRDARRLGAPRPVTARPIAFTASRVGTTRASRGRGPRDTTGAPAEAKLDYWRQDALANEHHQHWHQVYPFSGLLPEDWTEWANSADRDGLAELLNDLEPRGVPQWRQFVDSQPAQAIAEAFVTRAQELSQRGFLQYLRRLARRAYATLFRLNDRQGELFVYMHTQMLARYDAERLSVGLAPVTAFATPYTEAPPDGYEPAPLPGYIGRPAGVPLSDASAAELTTMHTELARAIANGALLGSGPDAVPIDRTIIGEAIEAAEDRLRQPLRSGSYPGLHNTGHMRIAGISNPPPGTSAEAVMADPTAAIRDPIFWRWHKGIDDLAVSWQNTQPSYTFSDAPDVIIRNALDGAPQPWESPDLYLVTRPDFAESEQAATKIAAALSGEFADAAVSDGSVTGLSGYQFTSTLSTRLRRVRLAGNGISFLTHEPFGYAVRIANSSAQPAAVTVRVFLCPNDFEDRRTAWIELDKVLHEIPAGKSSVLYRSDRDFSVIKRPAETDPGSALEGGTDPDDGNYCVCGWPWTLLIPRGTPDGLPCRLFVIATDAAVDQVPTQRHCGSMSYCGAADRYPDARDMGYPFSRPMPTGPAATTLAHDSIAGRSLTIRHESRRRR